MRPGTEGFPAQLMMQRRQICCGRVAQVCELKVRYGRIWVTQEGRSEDFWLEPGTGMVLLPGALVVIEADLLSHLRIEPVALQTVHAWLGMCAAALRGLAGALGGNVRRGASALLHGGEGR